MTLNVNFAKINLNKIYTINVISRLKMHVQSSSFNVHPGRLVLEKKLTKDKKSVVEAAKMAKERLAHFTNRTEHFRTGQACFNPSTQNLEISFGLTRKGTNEQLFEYKSKCVMRTITVFVDSLQLPEKSEVLKAYFFNVVVRPKERVSTIQEDDTAWTRVLVSDKQIGAWIGQDRLYKLLNKLEKGTWKTAEEKAAAKEEKTHRLASPEVRIPLLEEQIGELQEGCSRLKDTIPKKRKKFLNICEEMFKKLTKLKANGYLREDSTEAQKVRNTLYDYLKAIHSEKIDLLSVEEDVKKFFADRNIQNRLLGPLCEQINKLNALFNLSAQWQESVKELNQKAENIREQINPAWDQAENLKSQMDEIEKSLVDVSETVSPKRRSPENTPPSPSTDRHVPLPSSSGSSPRSVPPRPQHQAPSSTAASSKPPASSNETKKPRNDVKQTQAPQKTMLSIALSYLYSGWQSLWSGLGYVWNLLWR